MINMHFSCYIKFIKHPIMPFAHDLQGEFFHLGKKAALLQKKNLQKKQKYLRIQIGAIWGCMILIFSMRKEKEIVRVNGRWPERLAVQLRSMREWQVKELQLYQSQRRTVLKQIAHIHFERLIILNVGINSIQSIEGIHTILMPHLQLIDLSGNRLISTKMLRKARWPCLEIASMGKNHFSDIRNLSECSFPVLEEFFFNDEQDERLIDHNLAAKWDIPKLDLFGILPQKFCFQRSTQYAFDRKWIPIAFQ